MKHTHLHPICFRLFSVAALLTVAVAGRGQTISTSYTNSFDNAGSVASWHHWYDINAPTYNGPLMPWDPTMDHTPSVPGSGSVLYSNTWPGHAVGVNSQGQDVFYGTFGNSGIFDTSQSIDPTKYDSISFDLHADPSCPTNAQGNICTLQVGTFYSYNFFVVSNVVIPTSTTNGWTHYVCRIDKSTIPTNLVQGICFGINGYGGGNPNALLVQGTSTTMFWLDNVQINVSKGPSPPPTMSTQITAPLPGLNLFSEPPGDQYQRTSIKFNQTTGVGWLGQSGVSYSLTITNFPSGIPYTGYQAHIFITTGPGTASALDYNETNVIFFDVHQNPNGTAYGAFRYKVNEPSANSNMFGAEFIGPASAGTLGTLGASTVFGTWSLTFDQDTNVTVSGPGNASTVFHLRPEAAANFVEPLNLVFGAQPNQQSTNNVLGNVGQDVVLAAVSATNGGAGFSIVDDNFLVDSPLNTSLWTILSGVPNTVVVFPFDPGQKLVSWKLPDSGYGLEVSTDLAVKGAWNILSGPDSTNPPLTTYTASGSRFAVVPSAYLGPSQDYFRLLQQTFTKLQVLLPGETAAPGTPTGKTGTPTHQTIGVPFNVTVNAVDSNWTVITGVTDTIHITCTDTAPNGALLPSDAPLVGGTGTFSVILQDNGTFTVTASDVTDSTKASGTSSSVTAP